MSQPNSIEIAFGRRAKRRFGSIRMDGGLRARRENRASRITINGVFRDERIPEEIIRATIAHELCHYAHGFCSPLPQKYKHPHQGSVVHRELKGRGLHHLHEYEKIWSKNNWPKIVAQEFPRVARGRRPVRRSRKASAVPASMRPGLKLLADFFKP